jgi:hypothetical protein
MARRVFLREGRLSASEVRSSSSEECRVVTEETQTMITPITEQSSHLSRCMVMVYHKETLSPARLARKRADMLLANSTPMPLTY